MSDLLAEIADAADELTNPIRCEERLETPDGSKHVAGRNGRAPKKIFTAILPSLLTQLRHAVIPGETYSEEEHAHTPPGSRPAARLDAVASLLRIEAAVTVWSNRLDLDWRTTTAAQIRGLVGAAPRLFSGDLRRLASDVAAWRTWAAVTTGWERPADAPRGTCPACAALNTIRVRLATKKAICISCGAYWTEDTIGVLAAHITMPRATTDTKALRTAAVMARREWEARRLALAGRRQPDLPRACTECGTIRCQDHVAVST